MAMNSFLPTLFSSTLLLSTLFSWVRCEVSFEATLSRPQSFSSRTDLAHLAHLTDLHVVLHIRFDDDNEDVLAALHFDRFKVGLIEHGECQGDWMRIEERNLRNGGKFCGENLQKHVYYSQNRPWLDVHFHLSSPLVPSLIDFSLSLTFPARQTTRLPSLAPLSSLGDLVPMSFCERLLRLSECLSSALFVSTCRMLSPNFPGILPRGVNCSFSISADQSDKRLKIFAEPQSKFNLGRTLCDDPWLCPTFTACNSSRLEVYDGVDTLSSLIGVYCGSFPRLIASTGPELLLRLVTVKEGGMVDEQFDLHVAQMPINADFCDQTLTSGSGTIISVSHWYGANFNCTTVIKAASNESSVRLIVPSLKVGTIDSHEICPEYLNIYDSDWTRDSKLLRSFCTRNKILSHRREARRLKLISRSRALTISFVSRVGSSEGSSIQFWANFDIVPKQTLNENCHRILDLSQGQVLLRGLAKSCLFVLADDSDKKLVEIEINWKLETELEEKRDKCAAGKSDRCEDQKQHLLILRDNKTKLACFSSCNNASNTKLLFSHLQSLSLKVVNKEESDKSNYIEDNDNGIEEDNNNKNVMFNATIRSFHPLSFCGPSLPAQMIAEGQMRFPTSLLNASSVLTHISEPFIECRWEIMFKRSFKVLPKQLNLTKSCTELFFDRQLIVRNGRECGKPVKRAERGVIVRGGQRLVVRVIVKKQKRLRGQLMIVWQN